MLKAFVGHSFNEADRDIVRSFLDFFNKVVNMGIGFTWDHAESAEPKELSLKVKEKMEGKNLFIGICTPREKVIDFEKLTALPFSKNRVWSLENNFYVKTSDWLLQEIGFAFGRDMKLIILLESGTRVPGGIQGDIEYISFSRENPEKSFPKIIDMLNALRASVVPQEQKEFPGEAVISEQLPGGAEVSRDKPVKELPRPDWTKNQYEGALVRAVIDEDKGREEEINEKFYESELSRDQNSRAAWQAYYLYLRIILRNENLLSELMLLEHQNPNSPDVLSHIGGAYSEYKEYERAASYFEKSASLTEDIEQKFHRLNAAAINYAKLEQKEKAFAINRQSLSLVNKSELTLLDAFTAQADFFNTVDESDNYKVFLEAALELYPEDHDRRFSLAYKYSQDGENNLALYHYRILTQKRPTGTVWNNLGVALERLGFNALSVNAYRSSEALGETLAMSNLALKLINAGFLKEANELATAATSKENYHPNIGSVITLIRDTKENQDKEEEKIVEALMAVRRFYADYANAYMKEDIQIIPENWKGPSGPLKITINRELIEIVGSYDKSIGFAEKTVLKMQDKKPPIENVKYTGKITGYSALFQSWIWEGEAPLKADATAKSKGILVIDDNKRRIRILESESRKDGNIIELTLIE